MTEAKQQPKSEANAGLNEAHRFGSASESLFRRLYRSLNRRQQLEGASQTAQVQSLRRRHEALQGEHQRRGTELERLNAVLQSLDEGIIAQDPSGKVTMMNPAAEKMLGGKRAFWDSALGTLFERFRDVETLPAELTPLGDAAELPLNNLIVRAQLVAIADERRRRIGTVILLRDITYDALAQRLKDGFARRIAGEMQKPISVIKLAGELLSGQPEDSAVNQRLLEKLLQNVDILDQLALELLDIAKMDAGTFEVAREPLAAEAMLWAVANGMTPELRQRGIDLLVMTRGLSDAQLHGDETRLQWALAHLLRNGAQFSQEGGYVALAARAEQRNAKPYLLISVSDDGAGISEADMPHIFERFYRGGAESETQPAGLGQGLFVAKAICEAHGGYLSARSRLGVGSIFTMALPLKPR